MSPRDRIAGLPARYRSDGITAVMAATLIDNAAECSVAGRPRPRAADTLFAAGFTAEEVIAHWDRTAAIVGDICTTFGDVFFLPTQRRPLT